MNQACELQTTASNAYVLRPYQQECVDIINSLDSGSYLVVMGVGLGKTVTFSHINRRGRMLIISHREELVYQPRKYFNCSYGVERAEETSNGEEVVSASVQSLVRRLDKFAPDEFDILITDECHHATAPSYRKIYDYFKPRLHLGFTATPNRADKSYLGEIYSKIIYEKDLKWGVKNNYLCDIECMKVNIGYDLSKVNVRMGDFANNELADAVDIEQCNKVIGEVYDKYAVGQTVIFAASVEHAHNISKYIPDSVVITYETENRAQILQDFTDKKIRCIINNLILTEGTDLPCIETIIMARPTKNISLYIQAVGRGTRLYQGKNRLLLIDCVGISDKIDVCTAPVLFGIDTNIAQKMGQDSGLLSTMEDRIEEAQNDMIFNKDFWIRNTELINIFTDNGNLYDTHNINFTVMGNKGLACSIGNCRIMRISAENMLGKTRLVIFEKNTIVYDKDDISMQDALDTAWEILNNEYIGNRSLWDVESAKKWGKGPASDKQKDLIKRIYKTEELYKMKTNFFTLTKFQASILINRRFAESKRM